MKTLCLFLSCFLLSSCSSGYKSFYTTVPGASPEMVASQRAQPAPATPRVERLAPGDPQAIATAYNQRGYQIIGYSSFNSGQNESEDAAIEQGKDVGADIVAIINPQYTGTVTSSIPITTPTTSTSRTSASATAYGPAGTATAYGNATTTTYGSSTTYVPVSVDRRDYGAVYLVKVKYKLGAYARDLSNEERQALQTNQGAVIYIIVDGEPAFHADLLPGDVVNSIGGTPTPNTEAFGKATAKHAGELVDIRFKRKGADMVKQVRLNQ